MRIGFVCTNYNNSAYTRAAIAFPPGRQRVERRCASWWWTMGRSKTISRL